MTENRQDESAVYRFILDKIDSVPHLEALLLVWGTRPKSWSPQQLATRLYINPDAARTLLQDLCRDALIMPVPDLAEQYFYQSVSAERDELIAAVDRTYRTELVRVSTMIHSKASSAVRDFARAFRFTKERE